MYSIAIANRPNKSWTLDLDQIFDDYDRAAIRADKLAKKIGYPVDVMWKDPEQGWIPA